MAAVNGARGELRARRDVALAGKRSNRRQGTAISFSALRRSPFAIRYSAGPLPHLRPLVDLEQTPQPVAELAAIIFAHGIVGDHRRHLGEARLERRAPLGRVEAARLGL